MFTIIHVGCILDDFSWNLIWLPVFLHLLDVNLLLSVINSYILNVICFPAWCCWEILCLSLFVYRSIQKQTTLAKFPYEIEEIVGKIRYLYDIVHFIILL